MLVYALDIYEQISFRLDIVIVPSGLSGLVQFSMIMTFIQGHRGMR